MSSNTPSDDADEPVGYQWLHSGHFRKQIPKNANAIEWYPLYLRPPKPAEPEAETIETLKAENFELAAGQCTEGGPWGDEGGTPYCKYVKRKPMTEEEILELYNQCEEETSVHSTIFHFDKFARAIEARGIVLRSLNKKQIEKAFEDTGYAKGDSRGACFVAGVRFAEKHHGIGENDE